MFGLSVVTISLLLLQQLSIIGLLMPSTTMAAAASISAAKQPQPAGATSENGLRQRDDNGFLSDDVDRLLARESQADAWKPEDSVRQQRLNDEYPVAAALNQLRHNKLRPLLHRGLTGDSKQQQQQQSAAVAGAWLNGLAKRRAHIFVGKRSGTESLRTFGLRPEAENDDESDIEDGKRSRMFVGKRPSSFGVNDDYVDDTVDIDDWQSSRQPGEDLAIAEKRSRMFVGKKYAPVFVG